MKQLIVTEQNNKGIIISHISARDLHKSLEIKTSFTDWIKRNIQKYNFMPNIDYIKIPKSGGTKVQYDYKLTIQTVMTICIGINTTNSRNLLIQLQNYDKKSNTLKYKISKYLNYIFKHNLSTIYNITY